MGMGGEVREGCMDGQEYADKWAGYEKKKANPDEKDKDKSPETPKRDLKLEALVPYLRGQKPVVLAVEEAHGLETGVELAHQLHLKVIRNHVTPASSTLDKIAAQGFAT